MQGLAVIRALGVMGVPVIVLRYDRRDMGYGSRWVREVIDCPHPERELERFVELLASIAPRFDGALLVPPSDLSILAVAEYKEMLAGMGYVVAAPDAATVRTCVDKSATYAFAQAHGVPAPRSIPLTDVAELERFADQVEFPWVLKPTVSHRYKQVFGCKWTRADNLRQAREHYRDATAAGLDLVAQELIPGDELRGANYNAYHWDSDGCVEMTAAKIRNAPAETGSPSVVVSRKIPELADSGRRLLRALGYRGFANVEFKQDPRDGRYKLIEINARHNLSSMLAIRCGISFPWLEYRHRILGEAPGEGDVADFEQGVYWIDITRDVRAALSYLRRDDYSLARFLRPYFSRPVFAVASRRDPRPALIRGAQTLGQLGQVARARVAARVPKAESSPEETPSGHGGGRS